MKKGWGFFLRLSVSVLALAGLVYALRGKFDEAFLIMKESFQWEWFLVAIVAYFAAVAFISWRLQLIFRVQGVKVSFLQTLYLSLVGLFFNLFFPSALGGDVAKGYFAYQYSGKKLGALTGVVLDRFIGFGTVVVIALGAFTVLSQRFATSLERRSLYGALGILVFGMIFFSSHRFAQKFQFLSFLIPSAKWRQNLSDLYHAIRHFRNHKKILMTSLALSFAGQFLYILDIFFLARSLGIGVPIGPVFVLTPLVGFASMAPSLSGLGVREAGFVFFFKSIMPTEKAFALSLIYDLLFYGFSILAGLIFAFKGGLRKEMIRDFGKVDQLREVGHD